MATKPKRLGKVVKVLNAFEVVINLGSRDGVSTDDEFVVYAEGEELTDPDTGESLGTLEIVRGQAFAKHVQDKITTLRSKQAGESSPARFDGVRVGDLARASRKLISTKPR
jgi:hypothetical protein